MYDIMFGIFETSLIMSGAILLLALIGKLLHGKISAAKRYFIWIVVAAALLVPIRPITLPMPAPAPAQEEMLASETAAVPAGTVVTQAQTAVEMWGRFRGEIPAQNIVTEAPPPMAAIPPADIPLEAEHPAAEMAAVHRAFFAVENPVALIHMGLLTLWIGGGLLFALTWIRRHRRFLGGVRRLWTAVSNPTALQILEEVRHHLNIRRQIRLMASPAVSTPVVMGLIRPRILLPEYMLTEDADQLRLTLFHEAMHIRRGDIFTRLLCLITLAVHWFNPLVHWMVRKTMEEAEQATDDGVLAHMGADCRFQYGEMLLSIVSRNRQPKVGSVLAYGLTGGGKKLKRRLENILTIGPIPRWAVLGSTLLLLSLVLAFSIVGCGDMGSDQGRESGTGANEPAQAGNLAQIVNPDRDLFYGETLTIATLSEERLRNIVTQYRMQNLGVNIEIICFWDMVFADISHAQNQLGVQLMAGAGPVLIEGALVDFADPRLAQYFVDWFPLMAADPNFNEDDWFMNVFHASAVDGRLYAFPTMFSYGLAMPNRTIPGLTETLAAKEDITMPELMNLHRETSTDTSFWLAPDMSTAMALSFNLDPFMDLETGWVDFNNPQFIDFINHAQNAANPNSAATWMQMMGLLFEHEREELLSQMYLFHTLTQNQIYDFIDFADGPLFTTPTPIVNGRGELLVAPYEAFVLNAQATPTQQALAWDFIQFMKHPGNQGSVHLIESTNRNVMRHVLEILVTHQLPREGFVIYVEGILNWELPGTMEETMDQAMAQLTAFGEMPMARMGDMAVPNVIHTIILEVLGQFDDGLISAEHAAQELQNRISLVLMEMGKL